MSGDELREKIADIQHNIWIHWMKYLFSVGQINNDGSYTIPSDKVERWKRQMNTDFSKLSECEKESDREMAEKILSQLRTDSEIN